MSQDHDPRSETEKQRDAFAACALFATQMADRHPHERWRWEQQAKKDWRRAMLADAKLKAEAQ